MTSDKRTAPRLNRRFILRVAPFGEEPKRWSFVTIRNLSSTGVLFIYERPVREGMLIYLKIDFPDLVVECMGRVARIGGVRSGLFHDVAVHLESIDPEDQRYIEDFVKNNASS